MSDEVGLISDVPRVEPSAVSAFGTAINVWLEDEHDKPFLQRDRKRIRLFQRALNNRPLLEEMARQYAAQMAVGVGDDLDEKGRFQKFLEWVIANQDEIIRFITTIIGLFS